MRVKSALAKLIALGFLFTALGMSAQDAATGSNSDSMPGMDHAVAAMSGHHMDMGPHMKMTALRPVQAEKPPAPGKWSVKQVIGHLCDGERVFTYRAVRFSRGDQTALPGFEQDDYVREGHAYERKLADLAAEYEALRKATIAFFKSVSPEAALRLGKASGAEVSVRALAYITAGHEQRHLELMKKAVGK